MALSYPNRALIQLNARTEVSDRSIKEILFFVSEFFGLRIFDPHSVTPTGIFFFHVRCSGYLQDDLSAKHQKRLPRSSWPSTYPLSRNPFTLLLARISRLVDRGKLETGASEKCQLTRASTWHSLYIKLCRARARRVESNSRRIDARALKSGLGHHVTICTWRSFSSDVTAGEAEDERGSSPRERRCV